MPDFVSDGHRIAYESYGEGAPVVLVHGFASSGRVNWLETGWVATLTDAGYRAITIDNRGHGESDKPHDPAAYPARILAGDVIALIDELGLERVALIGYSMGARICAFAALAAPQKVACVVFGGLGANMTIETPHADEIIAALGAASLEDVAGPVGRRFRIFADHTRSDRQALAACMAASHDRISKDEIGRIAQPALVAVGTEDEMSGRPEPLAALLPRGEVLAIPRRDHMRATGDPVFKKGVLAFLAKWYSSS
ncbi:MAG TPA: alpha/beta hydrolase [Devosiaceae bacterium]